MQVPVRDCSVIVVIMAINGRADTQRRIAVTHGA